MAEKMTLEQVRDQIHAFSTATDRNGTAANYYVKMNVLVMDEWWKAIDAHLTQPAQQNCFCDRMYPDSDPGASCGDCPTRDYKAIQPAQAVDVGAVREVIAGLLTNAADLNRIDVCPMLATHLRNAAETLTRAIGNAQADD